MMNAIGFNEFGWADVLKQLKLEEPVPEDDEVIVRLASTSVNMLDILVRKGYMGLNITMPHVLGADVVGKVEKLGKNVDEFAIGDMIIANSLLSCKSCKACLSGNEAMCYAWKTVGRDVWGSYGELVKLKSSLLIRPPGRFTEDELACMPLSLATSWRAIHTLAKAKPGDTIVIRGASGNVGIFSTLIAKAIGLKVIALTRKEDKAKRLGSLKADLVINTGDGNADVIKEVKDFTDGGADFVLESFGSTLEQSAEMLHDGGKVILFGTIAGSTASIDVKKVYLRSKEIIGTHVASKSEFEEALDFIALNNIKPIIGKAMPITDAPAAHTLFERSETFGKIVLRHKW